MSAASFNPEDRVFSRVIVTVPEKKYSDRISIDLPVCLFILVLSGLALEWRLGIEIV